LLVFVLFFPESSLLALEVCCRKPTNFRICDFNSDHSVVIGSQIDFFLTQNEEFRIRISAERFVNDCSSRLQSLDGLFGLFWLNSFVSVRLILILMTTWVK
jgi:hypothetical protein